MAATFSQAQPCLMEWRSSIDSQNTGISTDGSNVTGFLAMHDSGTGGNHSLGNFPLFPQYYSEDESDSCKFPIVNSSRDTLHQRLNCCYPWIFRTSIEQRNLCGDGSSSTYCIVPFQLPSENMPATDPRPRSGQ